MTFFSYFEMRRNCIAAEDDARKFRRVAEDLSDKLLRTEMVNHQYKEQIQQLETTINEQLKETETTVQLQTELQEKREALRVMSDRLFEKEEDLIETKVQRKSFCIRALVKKRSFLK